jgi:hypothetical protein
MATKEELLRQLQELKKMRDDVAAMPDEEVAPTEKPELKAEPTEAEKRRGEAAAFGRGGAYGVSLGTAPAIEEAASGVGQLFRGELPAVPGTPEFRQKVMERAKPYTEAKKQYPVQFGVGEFVGTAATSLPLSAGAAGLGKAAAQAIPEAMPVVRGLTRVGTEAAGEAAIGAGISAAQGQDLGEGAMIGAMGSVGGQALKAGSEAVAKAKQIPAAMKQAAIESAPEALRPAAARMAESPVALEESRMAKFELEKPGGLEEQLKRTQTAEETKFKQSQADIEAVNKQKTTEYEAALSEEDKAQKNLLKETIDAVKTSRSEDAANKLSQAVDRGIRLQRQKAASKYDIAFSQMNDQVDPVKSQVSRVVNGFSQMDELTRGYAPDTADTLGRVYRTMSGDAATGAYTTGKEFKALIEIDQSLAADIRSLEKLQQREFSSNRQDALARLKGVKQELGNRIQDRELGLPKEAINQYNEAKAHYAEFSKLRDDLLDAQLLVSKKVSGRRVIKPTAAAAKKVLEPSVEDYTKTADVQQMLGRLPSDVEGVPAMTPEQFAQLKQQATTMPAGLLPERTRPAMPAPELQPVPTERVITPEEATLAGTVETKRGMAAEYEELARPPTEARSEFVPGKIGFVQKAMGVSPVAKISRAQAVEQAFKNPGLSFAVKVLEGQKKVFTQPIIQMLARQYQVDPFELQNALAEQQTP